MHISLSFWIESESLNTWKVLYNETNIIVFQVSCESHAYEYICFIEHAWKWVMWF